MCTGVCGSLLLLLHISVILHIPCCGGAQRLFVRGQDPVPGRTPGRTGAHCGPGQVDSMRKRFTRRTKDGGGGGRPRTPAEVPGHKHSNIVFPFFVFQWPKKMKLWRRWNYNPLFIVLDPSKQNSKIKLWAFHSPAKEKGLTSETPSWKKVWRENDIFSPAEGSREPVVALPRIQQGRNVWREKEEKPNWGKLTHTVFTLSENDLKRFRDVWCQFTRCYFKARSSWKELMKVHEMN